MYRRILVPLDGSDTSQRGLTEAISLARALGATLRLLHIVTGLPLVIEMTATVNLEKLRHELRRELCRFGDQLLTSAEKAAAAQGVTAETALREAMGSRAAQIIVDEVIAADCGAVVMGTHGRRGVSRLLLGSDASLVVSMSPVPVLLVRLGAAAR